MKKPKTRTCDCGSLTVRWVGHKVFIRHGWLRRGREAVCRECQQRIRIGPNIILEFDTGDTHEVYG